MGTHFPAVSAAKKAEFQYNDFPDAFLDVRLTYRWINPAAAFLPLPAVQLPIACLVQLPLHCVWALIRRQVIDQLPQLANLSYSGTSASI